MAVTLASVDGTFVNPSTYDAGELRRADAALVASAGITSGLAVSVDGSDVVTVTAGQVVISGEDAVAGTGVYRAGIAGSVTGSLEARDATNARIDLVVFRQYDTDVVASHPRYKSEIEIIKGTPSATPAVPTKPSMAVELARITVPASGGGAASVNSSNRVYAAGLGASVGAWQALPSLVGVQLGGYSQAGYRVSTFGGRSLVELRGVLSYSGGFSAGNGICTLPSGARPQQNAVFTAMTGAGAVRVDVEAGGTVRNQNTLAAGAFLSLDLIRFWTD